jgi:deoxyribonuclease IV
MTSNFRFGTVGSPLSTPAKPGGTIGGIRRTAELGLNALELAWVRAVRVSPATCEAIRLEAQAHDIALSVHAPYFVNLNASSEEWPNSRKRILDAAHFGNLAGATDIVVHPGSYFGRPADEVLPTAIERLRECTSELRAAGNPVCLRPEAMGKGALIGSLDDVIRLAQEVEGVQPCLDFAHLHARTGTGAANSGIEWDEMLDRIQQKLGAGSLQKLHIHLSGIAYSLKGEQHHLPFEEADLKYKDLLGALQKAGCSGRIMCESPILEEDALLLQRTWQDLLTKRKIEKGNSPGSLLFM